MRRNLRTGLKEDGSYGHTVLIYIALIKDCIIWWMFCWKKTSLKYCNALVTVYQFTNSYTFEVTYTILFYYYLYFRKVVFPRTNWYFKVKSSSYMGSKLTVTKLSTFGQSMWPLLSEKNDTLVLFLYVLFFLSCAPWKILQTFWLNLFRDKTIQLQSFACW